MEGGTNGQAASGVGHRRCAGCGWGEFFGWGVVRASEVCWFGFEGGLLGAAWVLEGSVVYV